VTYHRCLCELLSTIVFVFTGRYTTSREIYIYIYITLKLVPAIPNILYEILCCNNPGPDNDGVPFGILIALPDPQEFRKLTIKYDAIPTFQP